MLINNLLRQQLKNIIFHHSSLLSFSLKKLSMKINVIGIIDNNIITPNKYLIIIKAIKLTIHLRNFTFYTLQNIIRTINFID